MASFDVGGFVDLVWRLRCTPVNGVEVDTSAALSF